MILYGDFVSFEITVKLLLVPLPCNGTLIIGEETPPNEFVPNTALLNFEGGFIVPKSNKAVGWGIFVLPYSNLTCTSGSTIP